MPAKSSANDVSVSVRRAFAAKRMQSAWAMLSASQPGDRAAAIEGITRILENDGLSLSDVMTAILSLPIGPYRKSQKGHLEDDLFTHADRRDGISPSQSQIQIISGRDVPEIIGGRVVLLDDRTTRKGPELILAIVSFNVRYDPLSARCGRTISALRTAAQRGGLIQVSVLPPRNPRHMPLIEKVGMGIVI